MCLIFLRNSWNINRPRNEIISVLGKKDFNQLPGIKTNLGNIWLCIGLIRKIGRWHTVSLKSLRKTLEVEKKRAEKSTRKWWCWIFPIIHKCIKHIWNSCAICHFVMLNQNKKIKLYLILSMECFSPTFTMLHQRCYDSIIILMKSTVTPSKGNSFDEN